MEAYKVVDWRKHYEVNKNNYTAKDGEDIDKLKVSPLEFVRWRVVGHNLSPGWRHIVSKGWKPGEINELAVLGLFGKLLELAANQKREFRGWILDNNQQPLNAKGVADLLMIHEFGRVQEALNLLCSPDINWMVLETFSQNSREFPKSPGIPKKFGSVSEDDLELLYNETETEPNVTKHNERVLPEAPKPDKVSGSDLLCKAGSGSGSVQAPVKNVEAAKQQFMLELWEILPPLSASDETTYRNIAAYLVGKIDAGRHQTEIFQKVADAARNCSKMANLSKQHKIATFVKWCKHNTGFFASVQKLVRS